MLFRNFMMTALALSLATGLAAQSSHRKPSDAGSTQKPEKPEKPSKPDKDKPNKPEKPSGGKPDKPSGGKPDKPSGGKPDKPNKPHGGKPDKPHGGACCEGDALVAIVLTDDQMAQAETIVANAKPGLADLEAKIKAAQDAYDAASKDPSTSPEALKELFLAIKGAELDLKQAKHAVHTAIEALLTAEQKTQIEGFEARIKAFQDLFI